MFVEYVSLYTDTTSASACVGAGAPTAGIVAVKVIVIVAVVVPSAAVTTTLPDPGTLVASVTATVAFESVGTAAIEGTVVVPSTKSTV